MERIVYSLPLITFHTPHPHTHTVTSFTLDTPGDPPTGVRDPPTGFTTTGTREKGGPHPPGDRGDTPNPPGHRERGGTLPPGDARGDTPRERGDHLLLHHPVFYERVF